jgi:hypothetical protein
MTDSASKDRSSDPGAWPSLPLSAWQDTCATLHMWTQIVGKIRLARAFPINHWWHVPLYVTARGLTTSPIPDAGRAFQIEFDFIAHRLRIDVSDGGREEFALAPVSVAEFLREVRGRLRALGIEVRIWPVPVEISDPIPFEEDRVHSAYDAGAAQRFWRTLVHADRVLTAFRSRFIGKVSPVHFFWGSFDLAVTRFSGRRAPPSATAKLRDDISREAYSHEVSSCGFWPGNGAFGQPAFYAYAFPEPPGFAQSAVRPSAALYNEDLGQFLLPYEQARQSESPDEDVLAFLQSTYEAAADKGQWDRAVLERV